MKKLYTSKEIKDKINSDDRIKIHEIEKMLRHLLMQYDCLKWELDETRKLAVDLRNYYEGEPNSPDDFFPWEKGSE